MTWRVQLVLSIPGREAVMGRRCAGLSRLDRCVFSSVHALLPGPAPGPTAWSLVAGRCGMSDRRGIVGMAAVVPSVRAVP